MSSEAVCRVVSRWRFGEGSSTTRGSYRNMTAVIVTACWLTWILLSIFPTSAIARTGPGTARTVSVEIFSDLERTPGTSTQAKDESAAPETIVQSIQNDQDATTPQQPNSIFGTGINTSSRRRGLVGSSVPTCRSRCGLCVPCKPVHVAIGSPHEVILESEYYPEVWRCNCGNRYYMP